MNKPRRNANEAMELNPEVTAFIQTGAKTFESNPPAGKPDLDEREVTKITKAVGRNVRKRNRKGLRRSKTGAIKADSHQPILNTGAFAKATIQKTIRFDPRLIAEWEQINLMMREAGESPASFQQVANESLRIWLNHASKMR